MNRITADDGKTYIVESASEDLKFYYQWSRDVRRQSMDFTNEILRRLVTLTAVLLGGGIAFVNDRMSLLFQILTLGAFFCGLVSSFIGMMPYDSQANPDIPDEFREQQERAFVWKTRLISITGGCIVFGFLFAVVGLIIHLVRK